MSVFDEVYDKGYAVLEYSPNPQRETTWMYRGREITFPGMPKNVEIILKGLRIAVAGVNDLTNNDNRL